MESLPDISNMPLDAQRYMLNEELKEGMKTLKRLQRLERKLNYDKWYFEKVKKNAKKYEGRRNEWLEVSRQIVVMAEKNTYIAKLIATLR